MQEFILMESEKRQLFFEQAEAKLALPARSIEKDFWVCWILKQLFELPKIGSHLTFKGGTSLSKAWRLIERFSEDLDIVISRDVLGFFGEASPDQAPTKKQRKLRLEALREQCRFFIHKRIVPSLELVLRSSLPENEEWSLFKDETDPDGQTLLFDYPRCFSNQTSSYILPTVKIEMGARSDNWPAESLEIKSYVAEVLPEFFSDSACQVKVLQAERTFWEKVTLLHEETYRPVHKSRKRSLARHYYDLRCLIRSGVAFKAMMHLDLFTRVVEHRSVFFNWSWVDYSTMRQGTLRLVPLDWQLSAWQSDYEAMRGEMFFGETPSFEEIITVVRQFEEEFNQR